MRNVITVYCNLSDWSDDATDCFDYVADYDAVPGGSFVVAVLTKEKELLVPPDVETMTPEQLVSFSQTIETARRALGQ